MPRVIERTVVVDRPREDVFAYLSDFTTTMRWDPGTVETTLVSGNGGVGSVYHNVSRFLGRTTELDYEVEELSPGARLVLRGTNDTVVAHDTMTFTNHPGGGTSVTYRAEFTFSGLARLASPFLGPAFTRLGDEAADGLRDALTSLPPP